MNDFTRASRLHAARYPLMRPRDAVKLAYQSEFGGGHLLKDESAARDFFYREYESVRSDVNTAAELFEDVGNGIVRVNLRALDRNGVAPDTAFRWFCDSAPLVNGSRESFLLKLGEILRLADAGAFGFTTSEAREYLAEYADAGYPMVSHSAEYRAAYSPAYRVALRRVTAK